MRSHALRLGLSASLVLIPLVIGGAAASAATTNTAPDCSSIANTDTQAPATPVGGPATPTDIDVIGWYCTDAESDPLAITALSTATDGTATIQPADPANGFDSTYVEYTPNEGFTGRDLVEATVSDGTTTTQAPIYLHVVGPNDSVDCQPTVNNTYKQSVESLDYPLNCYSNLSSPDNALTYHVDSVSPSSEAGNVLQHDVDLGSGPQPVLTFNDQIAVSTVTVVVTATDTSGAHDTVSVVLDNQHDPVCTAPLDDNGYVTLSQRSSAPGSLTEDLGCTDPDGTPLTFTAPTFYPPNTGDAAPGTLTISSSGVVTFTPNDANWTGRAYFTGGEVTDGNQGWHGLDMVVDRYQQADLSASFTVTPASVAIGSSYTATMHVVNAGPDAVSGAYFEVGLPTGSVIGTLPSGCQSATNQPYLSCDYATIGASQSFDVAIPVTAGPGSIAGVNQIGTQFAAANLRNTNPSGGVATASVTLGSGTAVVPGNEVVRGSAAGTTISTGAGDDAVDGGAGNDLLLLGAGNDCGQGGAGNDTAHGGDGNDTVYGDAGPCVAGKASTSRFMAVLSGNDRIFGDAGDDRLFGGPGADLLVGGPGKDTFVGGPGADVIRARDHVRGERINCGAGRDVVYADRGDIVAKNCEKVHRR